MHKLVLLRHGESEWNLANRFTGWTDVDLSPKGVEEATAAAKLLKADGYVFDVAHTSLLRRAIRTLWITLELTNVRRHPTTFAGRRAVAQEADQGPWHGWAWAFCDGSRQYRVWFTGLSPVGREAVEAQRILAASARLEGP